MKKLIALSAILSLSAAFAEDVVYGTFVLNSSEPEVILGVPWVNPGSNEAIPVTDLIQTSTLEEGDQVLYYDLTKKGYVVWQLNSSKAWECGTPSPTGDETLVRGNAIILKRVNMNTSRNKNIIINGQVGTTPVGQMTMAKAQEGKWAYTLLAPPSAEAKQLSKATWGGKIGMNDRIIIGNALPYTYDSSTGKWGHEKVVNFKTEWEDVDPTIPAGQGAWYVSTDETGAAVTCTWN